MQSQFRAVIDATQAEGEFERDVAFSHFPRGCCGDAFHDLLEVEEGYVHICQGLKEYNGMCIDRMYELYRKIKKYIIMQEEYELNMD